MKKTGLALMLMLLAMSAAQADNTGTVTGVVKELGTSDAIEGVYVRVGAAEISAETDVIGEYSIGPVNEDSVIIFSAEGFMEKKLRAGNSALSGKMPDVYLERTGFTTDAVIVQGKKDNNETLSSSLSQSDIKRLPGNANDALRAMKDLPGIDAVNDFVSQLVVQGGGPSDNAYFIDNIPWAVPFHFGGLLSTINTEILSDVQLNSAGFGPRWGNRMGSVLNAETRPGRNDRTGGSADISLITAQLFAEGPLFDDGISFTLFGRRSYVDLIMKGIVDDFTALPFFWDTGATLDMKADGYNSLRYIYTGTYDSLGIKTQAGTPDLGKNFNGDFRMDNSSVSTGLGWVNTGIRGLRSELTAYYTYNYMFDSVGLGFNIDFTTYTYGIKEEVTWYAGDLFGMEHTVRSGAVLELINDKVTAYLYENLLNQASFEYVSSSRIKWSKGISFYVQDRIRIIEPFCVSLGMRYDRNGLTERETYLPRFNAEWVFSEGARLGAAWGLYSQFPDALQTDPEIGNPGLKPNMSQHTAVSFEKKFGAGLSAKLSAYYKSYDDLVVSTGSEGYYSNEGTGMAKGAELFVRWDAGEQFFAWISYSLSTTMRYGPPENKWVLYQYDQPDNLTLAASYKFTPAAGIGAKFHYTTGPLKKRLLAGYKNAFYITDSYYNDADESRLGDYLRLDIRADYAFCFEGWSLKIYAEVMNALNAENPQGLIYPDGFDKEPRVIRNIPILPYAGITAEF